MKIEFDPAKNIKNINDRDLSFERVAEFDFATAQFTIDNRMITLKFAPMRWYLWKLAAVFELSAL